MVLPSCPAEDWPECSSTRHHYHTEPNDRDRFGHRWPGGHGCDGRFNDCDDAEPGAFTRCYAPRKD